MRKIVFILTALLIFSSCADNQFKVDTSKIELSFEAKRLDVDLFEFTIENAPEKIKFLNDKYGDFFEVYNAQILKIGTSSGVDYALRLSEFIQYCNDENITDSVHAVFKQTDNTEQLITEALKHHKYYFPEKETPEIVMFISAFNESVVTVENTVGIALDKYLGEKSSFYERLGIEKYLRRRMTPEAIPADVMRALAMAEYPFESTSDALMEHMLYEGKIQYYLNCMLPETADSIKWRYTQKQFRWAQNNEENVWNYLVENKKLFETDRLQVRQYVGDAPFSTPFTDVSAPRIGVYVGYKIILAYMKNSPDTDLKTLMQNADYQSILSKSKYNPKN